MYNNNNYSDWENCRSFVAMIKSEMASDTCKAAAPATVIQQQQQHQI